MSYFSRQLIPNSYRVSKRRYNCLRHLEENQKNITDNMKHKVLLLVMLMAFVVPQHVKAQTFYANAPTGQSIRYTVSNGEAQVRSNQSSSVSGNLTIPSTVTNPSTNITYNVTAIQNWAFEYCCSLSTVTIPNSVVTIGNSAFCSTTKIYYQGTASGSPWGAAMVNDTVWVGDGVFAIDNADSALTLHIGSGVTLTYIYQLRNLINYIANSCSAIEVDAGNSVYASEDGVLYNKQKTQLLLCPRKKSGSLTIGLNVTTIGRNALDGCNLIDTVFFNATNCLPERNGSVSFYTISNASTHVNVLMVGEEVGLLHPYILGLPGMTAIHVDSENWDFHSADGMLVDGNTLAFCPRGRSGMMNLPSGISRIKDSAFMDCVLLTGVNLQGVRFVGQDAFRNCKGFSTLTIPATMDSICPRAFEGSGMNTLYYNAPNARAYLFKYGYLPVVGYANTYFPTEGYPLFGTDSLQTVVFGSGIQGLPSGAFMDCHNLVNFSLPQTIKSIAGGTFAGCTSITSMTLSDSLTFIGDQAFKGCSSLASINWPMALDSIGCEAFANCSSLTSVHLPDSLHTINSGAFNGCTFLRTINIPAAVKRIGVLPTYSNGPILKDCPSLDTVWYNAVENVHAYVARWSNSNGSSGPVPQDSLSLPASYGIQYGVYPLFYNYSSNSTNTTRVKHLIVGEGVRSMTAVWMNGVDTLTLPTTLDTVLGLNINSGTNNDLKYVYFNCKNVSYIYPKYESSSIVSLSNENAPGFFCSAVNMKHIIFGDSVQSIPAYCFKNCHNVREIVHLSFPSTVTSIGSGAFYGCTQIQDAVIPQHIEKIGLFPFNGCSALRKIIFNASDAQEAEEYYLPASRDYAKGALAYDNVAHAAHPDDYVMLADMIPHFDTIVIGTGVKSIPAGMFGRVFDKTMDSTGFNQPVVIVNNSTVLKRIGKASFANLQITTFDFALDSLRVIESGAFMNCHHLTKVMLYEGLEELGDVVFVGCSSLDSVSLPSTLSLIGTDCFRNTPISYLHYDCRDLIPISYELPMSQVRCGQQCFGGTENLTTIDFGPHVEYLNTGIFSNANGLTHVELPEGLQSIGERAFCMYSSYYPESNSAQYDPQSTPKYPNEMDNSSKIVIQGSGFYGSEIDTIRLKVIAFPSTLQYIGNYTFAVGVCRSSYSTAIQTREWTFDTIVSRAVTPPNFGNNTDYNYATSPDVFTATTIDSSLLIIPCGSRNAYENYSTGFINTYNGNYVAYTDGLWGNFANISEQAPYNIELTVNNDTMGSATYTCSSPNGGLTGISLTATPATQHHFVQWSDGVTANPRVIYLSSDTAFEAQFAWGILYTVNAHSSNSTRGSVTGSGNFVQNTVDTLIATPSYGYHFTQWSDGDTTNPRLLTVTSNITLTATFEPNQYTLEVFSSDTTQGTVSGGGTYNYNTNHQIHANPATGYHFDHWNDNIGSSTRSIKILSDTSFTAFFDINVYTLNVSSANSTMGIASSDTNHYTHGSIAILTATPNYGYHFTQWSDGDTTNPRLYTMTQNKTLTAQFAINQYTVSVTSDTMRGNVSGSGTYNYLSNTTFTAIPNYGYHFASWNDGDTTNPRTITITSDTAIEAIFLPNLYTVNLYSPDSFGTISIDSINYLNTVNSVTFPYLDTITLTANPNYGYYFDQWNDGDTTNPRQVVVTGNLSFVALYGTNHYTVTLTATHGTISGSGSGTYGYYATVTLIALPDYGYHFSAWSDGNTDNPRELTVTQDTILEAFFLPNQYALTLLSADTTLGHTYGSGVYNYLDTVQFGATDIAPHYHFTCWNDGMTDNPRTITLTQDTSFTAHFAPNQYTLTVNADEHGSTTGGGTYNFGDTITIQAFPEEHYHFIRWNDGNTENPRWYRIEEDITLTAFFAIDTHTVSVVSNDIIRGMVEASGTEFAYGTPCTVTATAYTGYTFAGWDNGVTANPYTFAVVSDVELTALFIAEGEEVYTVTVESADPSMGTVSGGGQALYGGTLTIMAIPNDGFRFIHWNDGNTENPRTVTVTGNVTYTAYFESTTQGINEPDNHTITVYPNPTSGIVKIASDDVTRIDVYSVNGKLVKSVSKQSVIDLSSLPSGVYTLRVETIQSTFVCRVIKN